MEFGDKLTEVNQNGREFTEALRFWKHSTNIMAVLYENFLTALFCTHVDIILTKLILVIIAYSVFIKHHYQTIKALY